MKEIVKNCRWAIITIFLVCSVGFLVQCIHNTPAATKQVNSKFSEFAGSASCAKCHQDIYQKHIRTEHHLTSAIAGRNNILGSFSADSNVFAFDAFTNVTMDSMNGSFFQVEHHNGDEIRRGRFDIVIGSGRKGQSYLDWIGDRLSQLPITYFSPAGKWSNSPGYPPTKVAFLRPITSRCLECHSTYFEKTSDSSQRWETFNRSKLILAVDCERCHGPGAQHVEFQTNNPGMKEAKYILNPGKLSRERMLDLCGLCHGGSISKSRPSFEFQAGDTLANYFSLQASALNADNIDVHGNQLGLLSLSKCYTLGKVTCISCHNIHENENGKIKIFSQRCQTCHSQGHGKLCKLTEKIGPSISENCIDCHMPKQLSHAVAVYLQGADAPTPALMRTHFIKIYPDETEKILALMKRTTVVDNASHKTRN